MSWSCFWQIDRDRLRYTLSRLFDVFDVDRNGLVGGCIASILSCGVLTCCSRSRSRPCVQIWLS
jgi:hypothetical protein